MYRYATSILVLTVTYAVIGKVSLSLALLSGYAPPIFPPAGIAAAALIRYGASLWPGIFLGSLTLNLWMTLDQGTISLVSMIIAFVAA